MEDDSAAAASEEQVHLEDVSTSEAYKVRREGGRASEEEGLCGVSDAVGCWGRKKEVCVCGVGGEVLHFAHPPPPCNIARSKFRMAFDQFGAKMM